MIFGCLVVNLGVWVYFNEGRYCLIVIQKGFFFFFSILFFKANCENCSIFSVFVLFCKFSFLFFNFEALY